MTINPLETNAQFLQTLVRDADTDFVNKVGDYMNTLYPNNASVIMLGLHLLSTACIVDDSDEDTDTLTEVVCFALRSKVKHNKEKVGTCPA